jgi:hypothetical protein
VYGYEGGKDTATGFAPRPDLHHSAHALEQRARAMCKLNGWWKRLPPEIQKEAVPELHVAPVAAGEKVVASKKSATAKFLKKEYSDANAVEMEGRGFLEAVHLHQVVGTVIRGISDQLSGKAVSDKAGWPQKAADAASAVAFELLASLEPKGHSVPTAPKLAPKQEQVAAPQSKPFQRMRPTLDDASFFEMYETLARVGVKGVDEVQFFFEKLPDCYLRVVPRSGPSTPFSLAHLKAAAEFAPLLKLLQYGCLTDINRYGVIAYDPGGPHKGGPAPLSWATQLFQNGELWLTTNTMIVRARGSRPEWVPIPFIPALMFEQTFFDKTHVAVAFAAQQLGLTFPCEIEMGLINTAGVTLAFDDNDMREIRTEKIIGKDVLSSGDVETVNAALLAFFELVYDATGYARPTSLFNFPPGPPRLT